MRTSLYDYRPASTKYLRSRLIRITISLGKYGTFRADDLLGRPLYQTYEVLERSTSHASSLRLIPAAELHAQEISDDAQTPSESRDEPSTTPTMSDEAAALMRNNQLTIDDSARQMLTMDEIEELKASGTGKEIIAKIMASHSHLGEKTAFSLAKYALRKQKKYMKRFTVLPIDVDRLALWYIHEKEAPKIMELREELIGLIMSWANVQCGQTALPEKPAGRWLVVEDTAGLLVAAMAERMGMLHQQGGSECSADRALSNGSYHGRSSDTRDPQAQDTKSQSPSSQRHRRLEESKAVASNTITLVHSATQPNLSLLSYFSFDPNNSADSTIHPLHKHLKTLTWLQLLDPTADVAYAEPSPIPKAELEQMKSGKRGAHHRKRRRWAQSRTVVDEARSGGFEGLVIATSMELSDVLHHLIPLLRGGAPIVIYSPNAEPLIEVADAYSSGHKTAFLNALDEGNEPEVPSDDFPVDPRLVLAPSLQTARTREWQVLPGRTHPCMTTRGGAEGYVFTGIRVLPAEGKVEARGNFMKRRKRNEEESPKPNGAASPYQ